MPRVASIFYYPVIVNLLFVGLGSCLTSTCLYNGVTYYPDQSIAASLDQCVQVRCSWTTTGATVELLPMDGCTCTSTCNPSRTLRLNRQREIETSRATTATCSFNGKTISTSAIAVELKSHCVRLQCVAVGTGQAELQTKFYDGCTCAYQPVQRSCSTSSNSVITDFMSGGTAGTPCIVTLDPASSNICQVRIDFPYANFAQPNEAGTCVTDSFSVNQGALTTPLCGSLTGKHMYVSVANGVPLELKITRTTGSTLKTWGITTTQIPCGSEDAAPTGCLQYYTGASGTVPSFSFPISGASSGSVHQINNQNYQVCVKEISGACAIIWDKDATDNFAFTVTGNVAATDPSLIGSDLASSTGAACTTDYVTIAGVRYCGLGFPSVRSSNKPFTMNVKTDGNETPDFYNRGFRLKYNQLTSC